MDEQKFREGMDVIAIVLKVFVAAKNDKGKTFLNELSKADSNYLSSQLQEYKEKNDSDKKVNGLRVQILERLLNGGITFEEVEQLFKEGKTADGYGNWGTFGVLYSLYYNKYKPQIVNFFKELKESLKKDLGTNDIHIGYNHFDGGQNQGKERIYLTALNNCWRGIIEIEKDRANKKEVLTKIKQFRIETIGDNIFRVGLFTNDEYVPGEYQDFTPSELSYEKILSGLNNYKETLLADKLPDVIEYIKEHINNYADIKEKAEQERKEFNEKFPLEKLKELPLEEYNYGMGNANAGSFTWHLNTDYAIAGWLFSNGQNWLFFKEDGEYKLSKNMKDYLKKGKGDIKAAFEIYKNDLYNFVKNFDINTYDPKALLAGASYIKAALIFLYKGDIFVTLGLRETCFAIANALDLLPGDMTKTLKDIDFLEYDKKISDCLIKEIPDIIEEYGFSAIGKCLDKYYESFLMKRIKKEKAEKQKNYYAVGADLGNGDKQAEFYSQGKLIIGRYEIGDLKQFQTEDELLQKFKELNYNDTETHFKQTFSTFKQLKPGDIVCLKSVHLQKHEMYIYAVGEVLEGYDNGYEYLDGLGHSLPVKWKRIEPRYVVDGAKYQKTLTKISDEEIKKLLDKLLGNDKTTIPLTQNPTKTMIDLNTILYGVPGTGKTYHTINYALSIIENKPLEEINKEDRDDLRKRYDDYLKEGRIIFTTFHQSFGYEDFIEGIKADVVNEKINYSVEDGIFKKLCKVASKNYEDSKKDLTELNDEFDIDTKINNFLSKAIEDNSSFKLVRGGKFVVSEVKDERIILNNSANEKWGTIRLDTKKLNSLVSSGSDFKSVSDIAEFLHGGTRWQEDSYYYTLYNEIKKLGGAKKKTITEKVDLKNYVLIIDEINRGNISKIFGELITLLEPDKRIGNKEELIVKLPYSHHEFGVPCNVYVLGTMNTADRSIALMDLALRRRFKFREIEPNPELLKDIPDIQGINIKELFITLNKRIEFLYDRDHLLGHAYFLPLKEEAKIEKLNSIMLDNIVPLLQEYFHDDWEKIQLVLGEGIVKSEMMSAKELGINNSEYDDYPKYTINTHLSAQDYPH